MWPFKKKTTVPYRVGERLIILSDENVPYSVTISDATPGGLYRLRETGANWFTQQQIDSRLIERLP
jgi:hypothetical protein